MTTVQYRDNVRPFLAAALRRPVMMGALTPTMSRVSALAAEIVPGAPGAIVLELGAGTGAITDAISARLGAAGRQLAVELDADLAEHLRRTRPGIEVCHADAAALDGILATAGIGPGRLDAVVSSLPWTLLAPERRGMLLGRIAAALRPGGAFTAIGHLTAIPRQARTFRAQLAAVFREVTVSRVVWSNLPPARVYRCRVPRD